MSANWMRRCVVPLAASLVLLAGVMVHADEPEQYEAAAVRAPHGMFTIYEVAAGKETDFLDVMVKNGPYNTMSPTIANEKILQPLPASGKTVFFSVSRHYSKADVEAMQARRNEALAPLLVSAPVQVQGTLVEHLLADWGWERGTQSNFMRVLENSWEKGLQTSSLAVRRTSSEEIFKKFLGTLAFFKSGYCGQVGMLEFFPAGTNLDHIRATVGNRSGFSGASIFSLGKKKGFAVYSEFFKGPAKADRQAFLTLHGRADGKRVTGSQAGMVVQNYRPR